MRLKTFRIAAIVIALVASGLTVGIKAPQSAEDASPAQSTAKVQTVERLVIEYSDGDFSIISRTSIQKVLPPSTELPAEHGSVRGTWFEVQNDEGTAVYRRPMTSPRILVSETLDDTTGQIQRAESEVSERVFSVLIPARDDAKSLVIFDSPSAPEKRTVAASEVGRLNLR